MKRPEKKHECHNCDMTHCSETYGYNQACDEWEAFLPSVEELTKIILDYLMMPNALGAGKNWEKKLAKAIHARLMGGE